MIDKINAWDMSMLQTVQSLGDAWYPASWFLSYVIGRDWLVVPAAVIALVLINKKRVALEIIVIYAICALAVFGIKHIVEAPRPFMTEGLVVQYVDEGNYGMPSGHAVLSVTLLGWLWYRHPKSMIMTIGALIIVLMIGLSRIHLGVHFPSQVLAGWALGFLFLWLFSWVDRHMFRPRGMYVRK